MNGGNSIWLHGHWGGFTGVIHYSSWKINNGYTNWPHSLDEFKQGDNYQFHWLILCASGEPSAGQAYVVRNDGDQSWGKTSFTALVTTNGYGQNTENRLHINRGMYVETSNFAVAEVMVWDSNLDPIQMEAAYNHLAKNVLGKSDHLSPRPSPPPPLPPFPPGHTAHMTDVNFPSGYYHIVNFQSNNVYTLKKRSYIQDGGSVVIGLHSCFFDECCQRGY